MQYLTDKMDIRELERIRAVAYHCWGYMVTQPQAMDIWRLSRGLPVVLDSEILRLHYRHMAEFHCEAWRLLGGK